MKVWKYATGQEIPDNAIYLTTIVEEGTVEEPYRVVWHYFLIEVKE